MAEHIKNFRKFWPLLVELVERDIKIKYRKSVLGILWTILNPLLMMIILSFVFSNLFRFNIENYPLYILCGQTVFNFFSESTSGSMTAILGNGALIKKVYIPKYLFVLSRICSSIINFLSTFCALILVMLALRVELHFTMFLVFVPVFFLIVISLGVGLILAALTVRFRDIVHLYSVFLTALVYLMPVIYTMSFLPHKVYLVVMANPLTNILIMFRDVVLYNALPGSMSILIAVLESFGFLALGFYVFYKQQDSFILNL